MDTDTYWASLPADGLKEELMDRVWNYYQRMLVRGFWDRMRTSYRRYHGLAEDGTHETSMVTFLGTNGEISSVSLGTYRALVRHMHVLATEKRPGFEPRPINSDQKSLAQVPVARNALEYFMREKRIDRTWRDTIEAMIVLSLAYTWLMWDEQAGPVAKKQPRVDPMTGAPMLDKMGTPIEDDVHEGDVVCESLTPMDVITDLRRHPNDQDWRMVRRFANRFDLAARYPEKSEQLKGLTADQRDFRYTLTDDFGNGALEFQNTDDVPVWHFFHKHNNVMPQGRYVIMAGSDVVLYDGPNPYDGIPVYPAFAARVVGTGHTYSDAWDLLGSCEVEDAIVSTMISINERNGIGNVIAPQGTDIEAADMAGRGRLIKYPAGTEAPAMLPKENVEGWVFNLQEYVDSKMARNSGINSTLQGDPGSNVKSGTYAALLERTALRYNAGLVGTATEHAEDVGTGLLRILKAFASEPRMIAIAGVKNAYEVQQFVGSDIAQIDRVVIDVSNPFTQTNEGKAAQAEILLQQQMITVPQYFEILRTGDLEPLYKRESTQQQLLATENEELAKGAPVMPGPFGMQVVGIPVVITDAHHIHIQEHTTVLADLAVRSDPQVVAAVNAHVQEHFAIWRAMPPDLAAVLGIPAPPPPPGMAPPPEQGAQPGNQPPTDRGAPTKPAPAPREPANAQPAQPAQPPQMR